MRLRHALAIGLTAATTIAPMALPVLTPLAEATAVRQETATEAGDTTEEAATAQAFSAAVHLWAARSGVVVMPPRHAVPGLPLAGPLPEARPAGAPVTGEAVPEPGPGTDRQPSCGNANDPGFPIETRIHGGPTAYRAGSGPATWSLDLTNTTDEACQNIHPVIVLTDEDHKVAASQVSLELRDAEGRWRALTLEKTDADETVGIVEGGFPGFAVPAGETVTVPARFAFSAAARPNKVVLSAATVQRRGDDGDWVGESNTYAVTLLGDSEGTTRQDSGTSARQDAEEPARQDSDADTRQDSGTAPVASDAPRPDASAEQQSPGLVPSRAPGLSDSGVGASGVPSALPSGSGVAPESAAASAAGDGSRPGAHPSTGASGGPAGATHPPVPAASERAEHGPTEPELAETGSGGILGRLAAGTALIAAGAALVARSRRLRAGRP